MKISQCAWWLAAVFFAALMGSGETFAAKAGDLGIFIGMEKVEPALLTEMARRGKASYLLYLQEQASLEGAEAIKDRNARGQFVYQRLKEVADRAQTPLLAYLQTEAQAGRVKQIKTFLSVNAIGVTSTTPSLQTLAAFPEVAWIGRASVMQLPKPARGTPEATVNGVEWNIAQVHAPDAWARGVVGEGIIVGNIDTGVQFDHPALATQYRGNKGGGVFDHSYNWWDPSQVCGRPSTKPCDNVGHGTHTMGTMVGDDGGSNQIGVAPNARWMACKGCENNSCTAFALLECGDFMLAPWDLNKANPDPSARPHIVNNSWGGLGGDPWYRQMVKSWEASGIFPAFSNGNSGVLGCATSSSPGEYPEAFSSGATDSSNASALFSSKGPSNFSVKKPDIAAPGVNVRSSVPPNNYRVLSGTSMASPHTAGVVALLWSLLPDLNRDVAKTEETLRQGAEALYTNEVCGGDQADSHPNNVFGWGLVDARSQPPQPPPPPQPATPLFGQNFIWDVDAGQCNGGFYGQGFVKMGDWTPAMRLDMDGRPGGCYQSFAIVDPSQVLNGLVLKVAVWADGDGQCDFAGERTVPINRDSNQVSWSSPYRLDTDNRPGGCQQRFTIEGRGDVALDVSFQPDGDPGQCGNAGVHTAVAGQPVQIRVDTDNRPGGCRQAFRLRLLNK